MQASGVSVKRRINEHAPPTATHPHGDNPRCHRPVNSSEVVNEPRHHWCAKVKIGVRGNDDDVDPSDVVAAPILEEIARKSDVHVDARWLCQPLCVAATVAAAAMALGTMTHA